MSYDFGALYEQSKAQVARPRETRMKLDRTPFEAIAERLGLPGLVGTERTIATGAFALGVERGRKVKALEWYVQGEIFTRPVYHARGVTGNAQYATGLERNGQFRAWVNDREEFFDTMDAAREACQQHHARAVLSMLEGV